MKRVYHTNVNDSARYVMGAYISKPLLVFGVNPSRATFDKLDVTVSKVKKNAELLGFDGWLMFNLYPQRSTDPIGIHNRRNNKLIKENLLSLQKIIGELEKITIWAAWGNLIESRKYFCECLLSITHVLRAYDHQWIHLGSLTKLGHPRHPSRMPYNMAIHTFDIDAYLNRVL